MIAPNRLRNAATSRSAGIPPSPPPTGVGPAGRRQQRSAELREELQLGLHRNLRRGGVVDDQELEGKAAVLRLAPLTAGHRSEERRVGKEGGTWWVTGE